MNFKGTMNRMAEGGNGESAYRGGKMHVGGTAQGALHLLLASHGIRIPQPRSPTETGASGAGQGTFQAFLSTTAFASRHEFGQGVRGPAILEQELSPAGR